MNEEQSQSEFIVCLEPEELNECVSNQGVVILKLAHTCYCYQNCPRQNEYLVVRNEGG
jgi:hypothetical protein